MARMQLGVKQVTPEAIQKWKAERGYDRPLFWNVVAFADEDHVGQRESRCGSG